MGLVTRKERTKIREFYSARASAIIALLETQRRNTASDNGQCEICDDEHKQWWYKNGYSESERVAICAFLCPPHSDSSPSR